MKPEEIAELLERLDNCDESIQLAWFHDVLGNVIDASLEVMDYDLAHDTLDDIIDEYNDDDERVIDWTSESG